MDEPEIPLDTLTEADFAPRLGQKFHMRLRGDEGIDLVLAEVTPQRFPMPNAKRAGFSIVFRSTLPGAAPQAIYTLVHEEMGSMSLFLVPLGPKDGGMRYEAVFG